MTMIEKLVLQLTEEQQELFFDLIEEHPDTNPILLFRRVLAHRED